MGEDLWVPAPRTPSSSAAEGAVTAQDLLLSPANRYIVRASGAQQRAPVTRAPSTVSTVGWGNHGTKTRQLRLQWRCVEKVF